MLLIHYIKAIRFLSCILILLSIVFGCKKESVQIPTNKFIHFPLPQKTIVDSTIVVEADSIIRDYQIVFDDYGGRWIKIAFNKLNSKTIVNIRFTKNSGPLILTDQFEPIPEMWLKSTDLIDANHPSIIAKANHLTNGISGINNKAKNIQIFVGGDLELKIFMDAGLVPASKTLNDHYGICINYARLFVALCRATGIPARSVSGCIKSANTYNSHHSWAEFIDEDGKWHPVDMSYTKTFNLDDIRYMDLVYGTEENNHCKDYQLYTVDANGDYYFYDGSPDAVDGKLDVAILEDNMPNDVGLLMNYKLSRIFSD